MSVEIGPKRLELLHELVPTATIDPNAQRLSKDLGAAGREIAPKAETLAEAV